MDPVDTIIRQRKVAHTKLIRRKSKVYEAFLKLEETTYQDGALPKQMKELIAVGISVVTDCESCMQWHITEAAKGGATEQQVMEAVEVGIEMGGGKATVSSRFAMEVMDKVFQ